MFCKQFRGIIGIFNHIDICYHNKTTLFAAVNAGECCSFVSIVHEPAPSLRFLKEDSSGMHIAFTCSVDLFLRGKTNV